MMDCFISAVAAGFMIGMSGTIYAMVDNRYIGAILFSIGLFTICTFGLSLFTGKVGYVEKYKDLHRICVIWVGNLLGAALCANLISSSMPEIAHFSDQTALLRLSQDVYKTVILSLLCGVLMFIAVETYRSSSSCLGILMCVPAFILCGFEHSIADMFYFSASGRLVQALPHLILVSLSNAIGALSARRLFGKRCV